MLCYFPASSRLLLSSPINVVRAFTVYPEEVIRFVSGVLLFFETALEFPIVNQFTDVLDDQIALLNVCL